MARWKLTYEHTIQSGPRKGQQEFRPVKADTFDPPVEPEHQETATGVPIQDHLFALQASYGCAFAATYLGEEETPEEPTEE